MGDVKLAIKDCVTSVRAEVSFSNASIGASAAATDRVAFTSTSISSLAEPSPSATVMASVWSVATCTPFLAVSVKPVAEASTVYGPAVSPLSTKCPASSVVLVTVRPSISLRTVTDALAIPPPRGSVMVP